MPAASELPRKCAKTFSRTKPEMRVRRIPAATSAANPARARGSVGAASEFTSDIARKIQPVTSSPIRIAGAGPSGLAEAIVLDKAGLDVEDHEAKGDVGSGFIGGLLVIASA